MLLLLALACPALAAAPASRHHQSQQQKQQKQQQQKQKHKNKNKNKKKQKQSNKQPEKQPNQQAGYQQNTLQHYQPLPANLLLVAHARESLTSGIDFRFGGTDPYFGLDGSAYVGYLYWRTTGKQLPRTTAEISNVGSAVPREQMMPGDLVFFRSGRHKNTHVGIYLGNQQFIHASHKYGVIRLASLTSSYWKPHFQGARRVVAQALASP